VLGLLEVEDGEFLDHSMRIYECNSNNNKGDCNNDWYYFMSQ